MNSSVFDVDHQNQDLASKIVAGLERVSNAFRVLLWDYAKENGLSPIQIQLLIFVRYHKEQVCNVSYLAKEFNLTKPTISDAIRILYKKELIEKITSETDRRAYSISLSKKGKEMVNQTEHFANPIHQLVQEWGKEQQIAFFEQLSQLINGFAKEGIFSVQRTCYSCQYYSQNGQDHYCRLLEQNLPNQAIRIDCPEHVAKSNE